VVSIQLNETDYWLLITDYCFFPITIASIK
jgi:hypothetical protein